MSSSVTHVKGIRKGWFALYVDHAIRKAAVSCFKEDASTTNYAPNAEDAIENMLEDWLQHYPKMECLLPDDHGCYRTEKFHEWALSNVIGMITAPGEAHEVN